MRLTWGDRNIARAVALALGFVAAAASAYPGWAVTQQVPVGPRAMAMGGAFSSIADDASAMFWNPAGMSWIGHQEFGGSYANLFQSNIKDNHMAFVLPLAPRQAAGFDWYHSGFDDTELGFSENRLDLSYSARWRSLISIGGSVKYLNRSTSLDGSTVRRGSGGGADLGVIVNPLPALRLGLVAQDLTNTSLNYSDGGGSATVYPRNVRAGASYAFRKLGTVAMDLDDSWHVGVEARPQELIALRAGVQEQRKGGDGPTWSTGVGVKWSIAHADFAYVVPPSLAATSYFGLSFSFNFNPSLVKIEKVSTDPLYASLYKRYDDHPFGTIELRNQTDREVDATPSIIIPEIMDAATTLPSVIVRPKQAATVPITAVLSDHAMQLSSDRHLPVQVTLNYTSLRLPRTEKKRDQVLVYSPGAMSWETGVAPAAAFITQFDDVVADAARAAVTGPSVPATGILRRENIARAAALFDAVATLGVRYEPDPQSPFASPEKKHSEFDTIFYPRQTLARRSGDCDDLTVLMASLLGNVGIATQLIDVPAHIFLMFDSGVAPVHRPGLGLPDDMTVERDGRVWIPLEATYLDQGFALAWEKGADTVRKARQLGEAPNMFVDVAKAQTDYEAAVPPGTAPTISIDQPRLAARFAAERDTLDTWLAQFEQQLIDRPQLQAHVEFDAGKFDRAKELLADVARRDSASAAVQNNLGNVAFAQDSLELAQTYYAKAQELDPTDILTGYNISLIAYQLGDTTASLDAMAQFVTSAGGDSAAAVKAGLISPTSSASSDLTQLKQSSTRMSPAELRALLARAARRAPRGVPGAPAKATTNFLSKSGGTRAARPEDLAQFLYWKP